MESRPIDLSRTELMHERLTKQGIKVEELKNNEKVIVINEVHYRIVTSQTVDFSSKDKLPIASVGAYVREITLLDPASSELDKHYQALKEKLKQANANTLEEKFDCVKAYTRTVLGLPDEKALLL